MLLLHFNSGLTRILILLRAENYELWIIAAQVVFVAILWGRAPTDSAVRDQHEWPQELRGLHAHSPPPLATSMMRLSAPVALRSDSDFTRLAYPTSEGSDTDEAAGASSVMSRRFEQSLVRRLRSEVDMTEVDGS